MGSLLLLACGAPEPGPAPLGSSRQGLSAARTGYRPRGLSAKELHDGGNTYAPIDIDAQSLTLTLDVASQTARGVATVRFHQNLPSRPALLLYAIDTDVRLNGHAVPHRHRVSDPDGKNVLLVVEEELPAGVPAELQISYTLKSNAVSFNASGVGLLTDMSDLEPAVYFERWGPVSFEEDQFPLSLRLVLEGASAAHALFTNGEARQTGAGEWQVEFPAHFTASSFFVHLTNRPLAVRRGAFPGLERVIPITVYSPTDSIADQALGSLPALFTELEADYGPFLHSHFVAYVVAADGGGMEYAGATITSLWALSHELGHSWFARGVMPADGRAQWIDEGIVTWRDQRYPTAAALLMANPTNLANYSPFMRGMPYYVHPDAARLMSEWDLLFKPSGGMKPLLRTLFERYRRRVITTDELRAFLEQERGVDLDPYFRRYVMGQPPMPLRAAPDGPPGHPIPFTEDELRGLR